MKIQYKNKFPDSPKCSLETVLYHQSGVVSGVSTIALNHNIHGFGCVPCFNVGRGEGWNGGSGPAHR